MGDGQEQIKQPTLEHSTTHEYLINARDMLLALLTPNILLGHHPRAENGLANDYAERGMKGMAKSPELFTLERR